MRLALAALLAAAACGDGSSSCPVTPSALPSGGPFASPNALPLSGCVEGGLVDLPGRWFVVDEAALFRFEYPLYEGDCATGFRRAHYLAEDHDLAGDGFMFHSSSDGTRWYQRRYSQFERPDQPPFVQAIAFAACLRADGTLAAVQGTFDTDRGTSTHAMTGRRFAPKDDAPVGLALAGGLRTRPDGSAIVGLQVAVLGTTAYVAGFGGLDVIDVSNPAAPVHRGRLEGSFNDVKIARAGATIVAYVSPRADEDTLVIDVTDPRTPVVAGRIPEFSHSTQIQNNRLFLATYTTEVPVYDITSPLAPVRLGAAPVGGSAEAGIHDLFVNGDVIYANKTTDGVVAIDTAPGLAAAVELGRLKTSYSHAAWAGTVAGKKLLLHGDEGMSPPDKSGAFLRILDGDRASPTFMQELARYQTRPEVGIHYFQLVGDKLYIAYYQDGIRVVSLADPLHPVELAHYNTWDPDASTGGAFEGALGIRVEPDGLVYVADLGRGLVILRAP